MSRKEVVTQENSKVEWVKADLLDRESLSNALKDIDIVVSSANGYMKESLEMDIIGNKNLIELSKNNNVKRFVLLSIVGCDFLKMFLFFRQGKFISDITNQEKFFGVAPTSEDVIKRWAKNANLI
jgi:putative NADH-flavin reductase